MPLDLDCACGNGFPPPDDLEHGCEYECEECGRAYIFCWKSDDGPPQGWYSQDGKGKRTRCTCGDALPGGPGGDTDPVELVTGLEFECVACKRTWVLDDDEAWVLDSEPEPATTSPPAGKCHTCEQGQAGTCPDPPKVAGTVSICSHYEGPETEERPKDLTICADCAKDARLDCPLEEKEVDAAMESGECPQREQIATQPAEPGETAPDEPDAVPTLPDEFGGGPVTGATAAQAGGYLQLVGAPLPVGGKTKDRPGMRERRRELAADLLGRGVSTKADFETLVDGRSDELVRELYSSYGPFKGGGS